MAKKIFAPCCQIVLNWQMNPENMKKILLYALVLFLFLPGCSHKKKPSLSGKEPVSISDFIEAFELVKPPFEISDSLLVRREKDSLQIGYTVFTRFVPDTILSRVFGQNSRPRLFMIKRVNTDQEEIYLFVKAEWKGKQVIYILCFDKDYKFAAAMPLLYDDGNARTTQVAGIDRRFSFYKTTLFRKPDGSTMEGREVYVFNTDTGKFMLIMTDALDDRIREVINPIDTLGRKHKYAGDYSKNKMNIVSIRDASKPNKINFFIHIEKNNGECTGELKGTASFIKPNVAVYRQTGDACVLQFTFTPAAVSLKEAEPCGAHRGSRCFFDDLFPKVKVPRNKITAH